MSLRKAFWLALLGATLFSGSLLFAASRPTTKKTPPVFPELAKRMHVAGSVRLEVTVDPSGKVQSVKALSGHQLLAAAASEAVKDWVYQPAAETTVENVEIDFK